VKTTIFEADPFSGSRGTVIATIETDYRWEKGDEFTLGGGEPSRWRVTNVRVRIDGQNLSRDVLALKL
jgi:hypothetical protein